MSFDNKWELSPSGKYFIEQDNSALIAFCMSPHDFKEQSLFEDGIRLVCAHTDSPTFKIKTGGSNDNHTGSLHAIKILKGMHGLSCQLGLTALCH